jgi:hypothetical protein
MYTPPKHSKRFLLPNSFSLRACELLQHSLLVVFDSLEWLVLSWVSERIVEENVTKTGISLFAYISKNKIESEPKTALQSIKMQEV